jgi:hypothetical protein
MRCGEGPARDSKKLQPADIPVLNRCWSIFGSGILVAAVGEVVLAFGWGEALNERSDEGPEGVTRPRRSLAQERRELGEDLLDRVQVRRGGRQMEAATE